VPTTYPKASPSEMMGLLVLLKEHGGAEDLARLADDLDLEIDEILPATDYAETLDLLRVQDGRASLTETGRKLLSASIVQRKGILREQLKKTTLFRTLLRALESSAEGRLSEDEVHRLIAFTTAPADELVGNVINWGRFVELFRYDSDAHELRPIRSRSAARGAAASRSPPKGPGGASGKPGEGAEGESGYEAPRASMAPAGAVATG
jgi:NitT/TauT family transport system ATP-binding protein